MSEFPQSKFSKIVSKLGWIFSPILLILLISYTIFSAEGLQFDIADGSISRKSSFEVKNVKDARVIVDGQEVGKSPNIFDVDKVAEYEVKLLKEGRREWKKIYVPKPGFVKTDLPLLFPENINFEDNFIGTHKVYPMQKGANYFFYEKLFNNKLTLHKYSINDQILGVGIQNVLFRDITDIVTTIAAEGSFKIKDYQLFISNSGKEILISINDERAYVITDRTIVPLSNYIPETTDSFYWSPDDRYLVIQAGNEIYSYDVRQNRQVVIHRPQEATDKVEIEFLLSDQIVYKTEDNQYVNLVRNSYEGNSTEIIDLPNIENIRNKGGKDAKINKSNFLKAYDMLEKQNLILIETSENIYAYDVNTAEIKRLDKLNRFKGERVIYTDPTREIIVTVNTTNTKQFRFYNLDQTDLSKNFTIESVKDGEIPSSVFDFNSGKNLILRYAEKAFIIDVDGANQVLISDVKEEQLIFTTRIDNIIQIAKTSPNPFKTTVPVTPPASQTNATPTPSPSISTTPIVSPNNLPEIDKNQNLIIKFEIFEN